MRPIKFNQQMLAAIREGRKTQTRRVVDFDPQPKNLEDVVLTSFYGDYAFFESVSTAANGSMFRWGIPCPYGGKINERLICCDQEGNPTTITLKIKDILIERLHDISEEDARAEGVEPEEWETDFDTESGGLESFKSYYDGFKGTWREIYPNHPTKGWQLNPFVWVIKFEKEIKRCGTWKEGKEALAEYRGE